MINFRLNSAGKPDVTNLNSSYDEYCVNRCKLNHGYNGERIIDTELEPCSVTDRQPELASNQPRPRPFYLPASGGCTQRDRQLSQSVRSDLLFRRGDSIMFAFKIPLYRRSFSFVVLEIIAHLSFFSRTGPIVSRRIFFFFLRYFF